MYDLTPGQPEKIREYTDKLRGRMVETVVAAVKDLKPATLAIGRGTARFAINRRQAKEKGVAIGRNPGGPVDHSVPVLKVADEKGAVKAIVFGYACHNTTMDFYEWCGDYAGVAMTELEKKHPGAVAMFWSGCGGDANPDPRRTIELCERHGRELAAAVADVVAGPTAGLDAPVTAKYAEVKLAYGPIPGKESWQAEAASKTHAVRVRAEKMLQRLEAGRVPDDYPHYPVQAWRFGDQLTWVALGGEVVVDYALRLKKELGGTLWVTGYANDVVAYIPSERVLKEGGYEADSSQIYYGHPTKWAAGLEEKIVAAAKAAAAK
jgi:neutral ceramidase